jgi:hypothetical protein
MKKAMLTVALSLTLGALPVVAARAQGQAPTPPAGPKEGPVLLADLKFSLDLRDASLRDALKQFFDSAKVDYAIDPTVNGFVTLKVTDQPFDTVLKLLLRSSSQPLTYAKDSGVYMVKPRIMAPPPVAETSLPVPEATNVASGGLKLETITLTYLDPFDLKDLMGLVFVPTGSRFQGLGTGGFAGGNNGGLSGPPGSVGIGGWGQTGSPFGSGVILGTQGSMGSGSGPINGGSVPGAGR